MNLSFLGGAQEVTGSCYLVETAACRFLVDCDFVLLTHAHIDHSGPLPRLVAMGYRGPIYATRATCDLLAVMLPDPAHIQEKEAERENNSRRRARKRRDTGRETAPLYTAAEA